MRTIPVPIAFLAVLILLSTLGLVFVWVFVKAVRELVWDERVRRRQRRLEDEQQRAYRARRTR